MNSHIESVQFDIKHEEVTLPVAEIKLEPEVSYEFLIWMCFILENWWLIWNYKILIVFYFLQYIKSEIKTEAQECEDFDENIDSKHEMYPITQCIPSIKIMSEVRLEFL